MVLDNASTHSFRNKIIDIGKIAESISRARDSGQAIAHCHGVFDFVHVGHIRHFEEAKGLADILVVTVTPDRFVNKGPHRPVFAEDLRVEAVAALDCVDYVAINQWPTAVEAIGVLRPDYYVKGPDYNKGSEDLTGAIVLEEEAVRANGGKLVTTGGITFSSSGLINRHMGIFPPETTDYLADFAHRYDKSEVLRYIEAAGALKVLVVGEAIIDEYQYCEAIGKSSKTPILALRKLASEKFAGGILAVANHVAKFCGEVSMVALLGSENSQEEFIGQNLDSKIEPHFIYKSDSPTIVKRRFIEQYSSARMMEIYEMNGDPLNKREDRDLCDLLAEVLPNFDVVIVVDFGHGMLSTEAIDILRNKSRFLAVNAQSNAGNFGYHTISKYSSADYVTLAEAEFRLETRERTGDLRASISGVRDRIKCDRIVVTRGKYGCLCFSDSEGLYDVPAFADRVIDRVGAGDAFLAVTALCVVQRAPMEVVGFIGNAVGADAVATVGHRRSVDRIALMKHIESLMK